MNREAETMKISVIIPVFNVEEYIERCLNSVLSQTYTNFELIIINDGSTDKSGEICRNFASNNEKVKLFDIENHGAAYARNFALTKALGEYVFFVDGDDFIENDTLEKLVNLSDGKDIIYCDYYDSFMDGKKIPKKLIPFPLINNKTHITAMPGPVCKLIKRNLFIENDLYFLEGRCFEDNAIMPVVSALANSIAYLQEPKYYYFQREGSALNQKGYSEKWEDIFYVLDYMREQFINKDIFKSYYDEVEYVYIEYLLHAANLRFFDYPEGRINIPKVHNVIKQHFPKWKKNKYFKLESWKYKVMCYLFYYNKIALIKLIRR